MIKGKKSQIWVSAVLFIALGIIAITLILTAAIPMINKITDKNTIIQSKQILQTIDDSIRTVSNEGPGSQRQLSPLIINKGELTFNTTGNEILWKVKTEAILMEPDIILTEGSIYQLLNSTFVVDVYDMKLWVNYSNINITLDSGFSNPFKGKYTAVIKHTGFFDTSNNPMINITIT